MDRKEAAKTYDSACVARIIAGVQEDPEGIRARVTDSTWPRYHDQWCDLRRGRGSCTCNRGCVRAKMSIVKSFYELAAEAVCAEEEDPFPSFAPSPFKRAWRHLGGRPKKYTPMLAIRIGLLATWGGQSIESAVGICGVCRRSVHRWRKQYYLFDAMLRTLEASRAVFPRKYSKAVLSEKKARSARSRRKRYVRKKAAQY